MRQNTIRKVKLWHRVMGQSSATQFSDRSHRLGTFMSFCRITLLLEKISVLVDEDNPINPLKED